VDTSVWVDYLREEDNEATALFAEVLARGHPFGLTLEIYQEVLQGSAAEEDFDRLAEYLGTQRFYFPERVVESHREAARLYLRCRQNGVTIRSTIDCMIACICIEHDLLLLHNDKDFSNMARVIPELRLA
jgi:predicted nucleic acid-binding protein